MIKRLLIVGFGSIGKRHTRIARKILPKVEIIVLKHQKCDDISNYDIDHCVTNFKDAIKLKPQLAVIANPATYHLDVSLLLANAGVHLLIEKPISNSVKGISNLIKVCEKQNLVLMVGYNLRFLNSLQKFRKFIISKFLGKVLSVRAEIGQYLPSWRQNFDYQNSVSAKAELGGGVLLELSHDIDYLMWLFGDIIWVNGILEKNSELKINVEDTAYVTMGFKSKKDKNIISANLNMDFIRHDIARNCTVICAKGTLRWNAISGTVEAFRQKKNRWEILFQDKNELDNSYQEEWKHFLKCINKRVSPKVTGQDGLKVIQTIESLKKSAKNKRTYITKKLNTKNKFLIN